MIIKRHQETLGCPEHSSSRLYLVQRSFTNDQLQAKNIGDMLMRERLDDAKGFSPAEAVHPAPPHGAEKSYMQTPSPDGLNKDINVTSFSLSRHIKFSWATCLLTHTLILIVC